MKYYMETTVSKCASGFGEYQCEEYNGDKYASASDIMDEIKSNMDYFDCLYVLGKDELPTDIEDIRGRIHNEPEIVFAVRCGDEITYGAIKEFEE